MSTLKRKKAARRHTEESVSLKTVLKSTLFALPVAVLAGLLLSLIATAILLKTNNPTALAVCCPYPMQGIPFPLPNTKISLNVSIAPTPLAPLPAVTDWGFPSRNASYKTIAERFGSPAPTDKTPFIFSFLCKKKLRFLLPAKA